MKAIWTGAIGFGLVNIPVKMYSATEESNIDFDMLDKASGSNIQFKRVNADTGKEVKWENIVKGFNLEGKYIILDDADFEKASPEKNKLLAIDQFVKVAEIDPVYFESPYYLEPQKNGESAYNLLLAALKKSAMAGIGTFVMRNREALGILRPYENVLLFQRMRYAQEIRNTDELKILDKAPKPAELKMAMTLIDQLSQKFDPGKYKDEYSSELMKVIKAKAKGVKSSEVKPVASASKSIDLMAQLKASLSASKSK